MTAHIVNVTEKAKTHIRRTLIDLDKEYLVFGLKGGGCAGLNASGYLLTKPNMIITVRQNVMRSVELGEDKKLVVDSTAHVYLIGSEIDYVSDFISSSLVVKTTQWHKVAVVVDLALVSDSEKPAK
jgi:Fe-S cluster assembly iron-binding protein IscA